MSYLGLFCSCVCDFGTPWTFLLPFFSPFSIEITSLGKREQILVLFVRLFDLRFFGFVCFLFLLVSGVGLRFNYWFSFALAYSRISHGYSSLFIIMINLIFMFSL